MRTAFIIQARMTSTRLPGKVLAELAGRPMLEQQIRRVRRCRTADEIVIATTTNQDDDPVVDLARRLDVAWYRGSEADVLSRYVGAARQAQAEIVVRLTADCPLIDPAGSDRVVEALEGNGACADYAANVLERTFPRGLDTEAFFFDTLLRMDRLGRSPAAREHVTVVARAERPELFLRVSVTDEADNSDLRWTVDTARDLQLVRALYEGLALDEKDCGYAEILRYAREHPGLSRLNQDETTWEPQVSIQGSK